MFDWPSMSALKMLHEKLMSEKLPCPFNLNNTSVMKVKGFR